MLLCRAFVSDIMAAFVQGWAKELALSSEIGWLGCALAGHLAWPHWGREFSDRGHFFLHTPVDSLCAPKKALKAMWVNAAFYPPSSRASSCLCTTTSTSPSWASRDSSLSPEIPPPHVMSAPSSRTCPLRCIMHSGPPSVRPPRNRLALCNTSSSTDKGDNGDMATMQDDVSGNKIILNAVFKRWFFEPRKTFLHQLTVQHQKYHPA